MATLYNTLKDIDLLDWLKRHSTPDELHEFDRAVSEGQRKRRSLRQIVPDELAIDRPHDFPFLENHEESTKEIV